MLHDNLVMEGNPSLLAITSINEHLSNVLSYVLCFHQVFSLCAFLEDIASHINKFIILIHMTDVSFIFINAHTSLLTLYQKP